MTKHDLIDKSSTVYEEIVELIVKMAKTPSEAKLGRTILSKLRDRQIVDNEDFINLELK